ncbi:Mechanosensitive ion channel [Pseudomonas sp. OF001]|uniref:mechanosensitive ion channel family protein n=1 Tax=unclassified Pseudomonas TaxID=196821 RepID=UPI00191842FB|nr:MULTISPECIES: mechanosensitive ion channel domain-containing protein [unclassified Pseudomonas]WPP43912.1 mechanosensitive ion channel [Pseudomonas sp. AN-1]CAD5378028.1 Mechanosensitive ion channel [Pseudomonas sp. OF001]
MLDALSSTLDWLQTRPYLFTALSAALLLGTAWLANWTVKHLLARALHRTLSATPLGRHLPSYEHSVVRRLSNIVPALILSSGVTLIPGLHPAVVTVVENVCRAFVVLTIALAIGGALRQANRLYEQRPDAHLKPIKGYLQVLEFAVYALAAILMVATLVDRSPLILLSGLGAMAAVLMLIFQHTLLSVVASVQISSNDILRVGDWVEMPALNADGDVIDIALHTVKVQNWDKTITCIPTKRFISDPFKNWRGMHESGGRRIKRSLYLDQDSVRFIDAAQIEQLRHFTLLRDYLSGKRAELDEWNRQLLVQGAAPLNQLRLTNLGTFRAYVENYLRHAPYIRQDMTLLVRQLAPTATGLPLELYCFTATTVWADYERIQADIFDHLLAILPEFGLRVFQYPSGADLREWRLPAAERRER